MEEPPECLTDSVDLGPEGCSVRREGFQLSLSLKLDVREYTLELSVEQLQAAQAEWSRKRTERLDWISEDLHRQGTPSRPFGMSKTQCANTRGSPEKIDPLGPEPKLSDFYVPSSGQRDREIAFVVLGIAATGIIAYKLAK